MDARTSVVRRRLTPNLLGVDCGTLAQPVAILVTVPASTLDGLMSRLLAMVLFVAVSAGFSGCGGGKPERTPDNRLIVLGHSIGDIRLNEPREAVEKAFGPGSSTRRGLVSYFGGRLVVDYWFHDRLTARVESLETGWSGFRTRSGVHVGSMRKALNTLHVDCSDGSCGVATANGADAPGTGFTLRHGKVATIYVTYS